MFKRKTHRPKPKITKEQILAKWERLQHDTSFIFSDQFKGLDHDIRLALANDLLDAWLSDLREYLHRDA